MNNIISSCSYKRTDNTYCSLTLTCKGWGCRFLATPIEEKPVTDKEKAKLFSKVYREAKQKGIIDCPHFRSLNLDNALETIN